MHLSSVTMFVFFLFVSYFGEGVGFVLVYLFCLFVWGGGGVVSLLQFYFLVGFFSIF